MGDLKVTTTTSDSTATSLIEAPEYTVIAPEEFDRFRKLASDLVKVPKAELDEKLKHA